MPARRQRATPNQVFQALHRFADRIVDPLADEILAAFNVTRRLIDLGELEAVLGAIYERAAFARAAQAPILDQAARDALARVLGIDSTMAPQLARRLERVFAQLTTGGALVTASTMPERIRPAFNLVNPRAVASARRNAGKLVREITDEQRKIVNRLVARGIREGVEPRKTARRLAESIGLTRHEEGIVARFRDEHAPEMQSRTLAEEKLTKRQRKILRQLQSAAPRTETDLDALGAKYRARKIRQRAMSIARTETIRASADGQQIVWDEAGKQGLIIREETRQFWMYTEDSRTECACLSIPRLNPEGVPLGKPFRMHDCHGGGGIKLVMRPGDPHPMCRCVLYVRFVEPKEKS